mmetsp:Transcript_19280/g.24876  ORF Transcript_19280/g.24876 Transcript_19280/m.24876 type:complete len:184 (+) Transcript_19280:175-726(+)
MKYSAFVTFAVTCFIACVIGQTNGESRSKGKKGNKANKGCWTVVDGEHYGDNFIQAEDYNNFTAGETVQWTLKAGSCPIPGVSKVFFSCTAVDDGGSVFLAGWPGGPTAICLATYVAEKDGKHLGQFVLTGLFPDLVVTGSSGIFEGTTGVMRGHFLRIDNGYNYWGLNATLCGEWFASAEDE